MNLLENTLHGKHRSLCQIYSWNSTGEIGRIGRHLAETHRYFNIRVFGQMPPDASDFPGGIPAYESLMLKYFKGLALRGALPASLEGQNTSIGRHLGGGGGAETHRHNLNILRENHLGEPSP